jgi:phosphatidylglycerophosphatase C
MTDAEQPIVVFDLDGTITRRDTYVPFLLYALYKQPLKILRLPALAVDVLRYKIGSQSNSWLKVRFLDTLLAGQQRTVIESWSKSFSLFIFDKGLHHDAISAINSHLERDHDLVLLSASLDIYVEIIGKYLGFKHIICTKTSWDNDVLGSGLNGENCYGESKVKRLKQWLNKRTDKFILMAYADHKSDFPILKIAQRGIVVNPGKLLRKKADRNQLEITEWK